MTKKWPPERPPTRISNFISFFFECFKSKCFNLANWNQQGKEGEKEKEKKRKETEKGKRKLGKERKRKNKCVSLQIIFPQFPNVIWPKIKGAIEIYIYGRQILKNLKIAKLENGKSWK